MAFVSVGQKYGFVSAGDVFRQRLADARKEVDEERKKAEEEKLKTARGLFEDGVPLETLVRRFNLTEEQIHGKWFFFVGFIKSIALKFENVYKKVVERLPFYGNF